MSESRTLVQQDSTQDDLVKSAQQLREAVKKELDKLKAEGKLALAAGLEKADKFVEELETQLKKLNPTTEVGKALLTTLEAALEKAKTKVEEEIKKLSGKYYDDTTKDDLKTQIDNLKKQAQEAIAKLLAQGKGALATEIKSLETHLVDLEAQLEKLNPTTEVGKALLKGLETLVKAAEGKLEEAIKKLSGSFYDVKDDLKTQIDNLKKQAQEAIAKLLAQGKGALATEIKSLETHLVDLEAQLEKLNPTTEVGKALLKGLETLVKAAEGKLEEAIKKLSGSYYDDVKTDLQTQIDELKKKAQEAIAKLMGEGKTVLAEGIKRLENQLLDLESQLEKLNPKTEIGKMLLKGLETLVKAAETKLEEEIKKLTGSFYADVDLKAVIMKQVGDLYDQAKTGIEELAKSGKKELVNGLEKTIKFIQSIDEKVKGLKPTTDEGKVLVKLIEKLVSTGVTILQEDLKKAQGSFYAADAHKEALLKAVGDVIDEAEVAIKKLEKEDKKTLLAALVKVAAVAKQIQDEFKTLNPTTPVGKTIFSGVSALIAEIKGVVDADIKKLSGSYYDVKDDLKTQIDNLKKQAQEAIAKLLAQGKGALATEIKSLETHLVDLEAQLEKLNPTTEVGKALLKGLETLVKAAEGKLEEAIKKLSGSFYADDVKAVILKQVGDLYDQAKAGVEELSKSGKKELVNGLEKTIKFVKTIAAEVATLSRVTSEGKILFKLFEKLVSTGLTILEEDLKKAQGSFYAADANKEALLKAVGDVVDEAKAAFEKLEKEDKKALLAALVKMEGVAKSIQDGFKLLKPTTAIGNTIYHGVSALIAEIKGGLDADIKKLSGSYYDVKDDLKTQIDNLKKQAQEAIAKLLAQGKGALATEIKSLETHLVDLEAQLEKLNPTTEVGKALLKGLETLIKAAEGKLEEEIKKLSGSFYDVKDDLKTQIDNLKKQAKEAIDKLKAQGKTVLAGGIKKLEEHLIDLESQLEKLNPQTEIGKTLLKTLEGLVKSAETRLEEEIKKLSGGL